MTDIKKEIEDLTEQWKLLELLSQNWTEVEWNSCQEETENTEMEIEHAD